MSRGMVHHLDEIIQIRDGLGRGNVLLLKGLDNGIGIFQGDRSGIISRGQGGKVGWKGGTTVRVSIGGIQDKGSTIATTKRRKEGQTQVGHVTQRVGIDNGIVQYTRGGLQVLMLLANSHNGEDGSSCSSCSSSSSSSSQVKCSKVRSLDKGVESGGRCNSEVML
eukprot:scaffold1982_cov93-Amphora_coffeaeformis.AAC.40